MKKLMLLVLMYCSNNALSSTGNSQCMLAESTGTVVTRVKENDATLRIPRPVAISMVACFRQLADTTMDHGVFLQQMRQQQQELEERVRATREQFRELYGDLRTSREHQNNVTSRRINTITLENNNMSDRISAMAIEIVHMHERNEIARQKHLKMQQEQEGLFCEVIDDMKGRITSLENDLDELRNDQQRQQHQQNIDFLCAQEQQGKVQLCSAEESERQCMQFQFELQGLRQQRVADQCEFKLLREACDALRQQIAAGQKN